MPLLENKIKPTLDPAKVQIVVVHCLNNPLMGAYHVQLFGLSYPMAFDLDDELFRRLRLPDHVYPLNVVIDREGKIVHTGKVLDDAVAAVGKLIN